MGLSGLFVGISIIISENIRKIADHIIENEFAVSEAGSIYHLTYDKIHLRLLSGNLMIKGLALVPKESFFSRTDTLRMQNPVVFRIQIPEIKISGLERNFSIFLDEIDLKSIVISQPEITLIHHLSPLQHKQSKGAKTNDAADKVQPVLKKITIGKFKMDKGKFANFDRLKNETLASLSNIDFDTEKFIIDLTGDSLNSFVQLFKNADLRIGGGHYPLENGMYDLRFGHFEHLAVDDKIILEGLRLIPKYDKVVFSEKLSHQTERMDLSIQSIIVRKPNLAIPGKIKTIEVQAVSISGIHLNAFRDKNLPIDMTHFPLLPQQALSALPIDLNIPVITITDANIVYEELPIGETKPGKASIRLSHAELVNVTNRPELIEKNGPMYWSIEGQLFDAAEFLLKVRFQPDITAANFQLAGSIGACNMDAFNVMTENAANLRINDGKLQKIDFDVVASDDIATGTLTMQYSDLSIVPLKKDKEKSNDELQVLGDIANTLIKNSNPNRKETVPKPAEVFFERDKNKSIFNYMAKSLLSGVKNSILPIATETRERYEKQQERDSKQKERQKRRKERKEKRNG